MPSMFDPQEDPGYLQNKSCRAGLDVLEKKIISCHCWD